MLSLFFATGTCVPDLRVGRIAPFGGSGYIVEGLMALRRSVITAEPP